MQVSIPSGLRSNSSSELDQVTCCDKVPGKERLESVDGIVNAFVLGYRRLVSISSGGQVSEQTICELHIAEQNDGTIGTVAPVDEFGESESMLEYTVHT